MVMLIFIILFANVSSLFQVKKQKLYVKTAASARKQNRSFLKPESQILC